MGLTPDNVALFFVIFAFCLAFVFLYRLFVSISSILSFDFVQTETFFKMSMMSLPFERLKGRENYSSWKVGARAQLTTKGLWNKQSR